MSKFKFGVNDKVWVPYSVECGLKSTTCPACLGKGTCMVEYNSKEKFKVTCPECAELSLIMSERSSGLVYSNSKMVLKPAYGLVTSVYQTNEIESYSIKLDCYTYNVSHLSHELFASKEECDIYCKERNIEIEATHNYTKALNPKGVPYKLRYLKQRKEELIKEVEELTKYIEFLKVK